ncbi:ESPR domain-containing protein [Acidaminococcus massiliensis]
MNKIYKVVWSKVRNCYVVVSELAKRNIRNTRSIVTCSKTRRL